ncbi:hypothetical protein RQP46_006580 [Phenoliferia psychrophenolica]
MKAVLIASIASIATLATADSLESIDHVVLYMQENRAFDHYFGSLAGVRGFQDPNAHVLANGRTSFHQKVAGAVSALTDYLLPFWLPYQGEPGRAAAVQCGLAGLNAFSNNQAALAAGENDMWVLANDPHSVGYFRRSDIPVQFGVADGWTVGDMYQTGSINIAGGNVKSEMGPVLDNNVSPFVNVEPLLGQHNVQQSGKDYSCYPYDWPTVPEYLENNEVSWKVFQAQDNFGDNPLLFFSQYQDLLTAQNYSNPLVAKGLEYQPTQKESDVVETSPPPLSEELGGLYAFQAAAASGTLPKVSYIVGPASLTEHAPYLPRDGAWFTKQIVDAVQQSPKYNSTVLFISYDEAGGTADHVVPFHSPEGTPGEWLTNPFNNKTTFSGPGHRLPFMAVSPWTRGGHVFTEPADHTSQILFLEKWLATKGVNIRVAAINDWRRQHMSDLTAMFDFTKPDYSQVDLPDIAPPAETDGHIDGVGECLATGGPLTRAQPPYGLQTEAEALWTESGFKSVRGAITEGRYLTLESGDFALTYSPIRTVLEATDPTLATANTFKIRFASAMASDPAYLSSSLGLATQAAADTFTIVNQGTGTGYSLQNSAGKFVSLANGKVSLSSKATSFNLFSVTF